MTQARKGLPVSFHEDGAKLRTPPPRDTRDLAPSPWGKRMNLKLSPTTMAGQGPVHTVVGRGVTPASDVSVPRRRTPLTWEGLGGSARYPVGLPGESRD